MRLFSSFYNFYKNCCLWVYSVTSNFLKPFLSSFLTMYFIRRLELNFPLIFAFFTKISDFFNNQLQKICLIIFMFFLIFMWKFWFLFTFAKLSSHIYYIKKTSVLLSGLENKTFFNFANNEFYFNFSFNQPSSTTVLPQKTKPFLPSYWPFPENANISKFYLIDKTLLLHLESYSIGHHFWHWLISNPVYNYLILKDTFNIPSNSIDYYILISHYFKSHLLTPSPELLENTYNVNSCYYLHSKDKGEFLFSVSQLDMFKEEILAAYLEDPVESAISVKWYWDSFGSSAWWDEQD